jgi:hypothetical protein
MPIFQSIEACRVLYFNAANLGGRPALLRRLDHLPASETYDIVNWIA